MNNLQDIEQIQTLLNQKPEIENKLEYYTSIIRSNELIVEAIDKKMAEKEITVSLLLGFLPIVTIRKVSDYERAKLIAEKVDVQNQIYYQKQYLGDWKSRMNEYEVYFDRLSKECNEAFDELFAYAKEHAQSNPRITDIVNRYDNDNKDQEKKNAMYLVLKQEIKGRHKPDRETAN